MTTPLKSVNPHVFISYSHDSDEHSARALDLSDWLRSYGVNANLDQYEQSPPEGWAHWTKTQIESSEFVLIICTATYQRRVDKKETHGIGAGATWEGQLIYNYLYAATCKTHKFVPIIFSEADRNHIPTPLAQSQYYLADTDEHRWALYRLLTNQPSVEKPTLGRITSLPPRSRNIPSQQVIDLPSEVASTVTFSRAFPHVADNEIFRENIINTIKTLAASVHVVVVEGPEGVGKTTLLSQIARRYADRSASVFLSDDDRASFDRETITDNLADQLHWALRQSPRAHDRADPAEVQSYAEELRRLSRKRGQKFYFLIDGLAEIAPHVSGGPRGILEIFPQIGLDAFTFIMSGDLTDLQLAIGRSVRAKSFPVIDFGLEDSLHFFEGVVDQRETAARLHQISEGSPEKLSSLRRLIMAQHPVDALLDSLERSKQHVFLKEWEQRDRKNDRQQWFLAQLCYDDKRHTESSLSEATGIPLATIRGWISSLTFLATDPATGNVCFNAPWFRRQGQRELQQYRSSVHKAIVRQLLLPGSDSNRLATITQLEESALPELLKSLSPDYIMEILRRTGSFTKVEQTVAAGLRAARRQERHTESLRFGINKSVLTEFLRFGADASEVTALAALGDYSGAMAITRATVPKEDKLHYLAIIANRKTDMKEYLEPDLLEQITTLAKQIDTKSLGERTFEICEQLITFAPELALDLAETAKPDISTRNNAFAHLSALALEALDQARSEKTIERIKASGILFRIDFMQKLYSAVSGKWSATEVTAHAAKLEKARDRLFLLRSWIRWNSKVEGCAAVVHFALDTAIKATDYTINATVLRQLADGLAGIANEEDTQALVGKFDGQKATALLLGPSRDYVRLQLHLAEAELRHDGEAAENRFLSLFYEITQISDLSARAESWAWFLGAIHRASVVISAGPSEALKADSLRELEDTFVELLDSTADHYRSAGEVIEAAARWNPGKAIELSRMLNTEPRRDAVLVDIAGIIVSELPPDTARDGLIELLRTCADSEYRDGAIARALDALVDVRPCGPTLGNTFSFLLAEAKQISNAVRRTRALCSAYSFGCSVWGANSPITTGLLSATQDSWSAITTGWVKVNVGFFLARSLSAVSKPSALSFLRQAEDTKKQLGGLSSERACRVYSACVRLASRAFAGLVRRHHNTKQDLNLISTQIEAIPSPGERAAIWAELALKCSLQNEDDLCREIYNEKIAPALAGISKSDSGYLALVTTKVAPAAFIADRNICWERLATLDSTYRDFACVNIIRFLFNGSLPSDPDEYLPGTGYETTYGKLSHICDVLERVSWDSFIYDALEKVTDSLLSWKNEARLKQGQKEEVWRRRGCAEICVNVLRRH